MSYELITAGTQWRREDWGKYGALDNESEAHYLIISKEMKYHVYIPVRGFPLRSLRPLR
jgi:hypothetical protein